LASRAVLLVAALRATYWASGTVIIDQKISTGAVSAIRRIGAVNAKIYLNFTSIYCDCLVRTRSTTWILQEESNAAKGTDRSLRLQITILAVGDFTWSALSEEGRVVVNHNAAWGTS